MYGFEQELFISSVDREDAGLYSCVVSNNAGTDRRYFNIIVSGKSKCFMIISKFFAIGPPEILRSHINTHPSVVRGSSITLSCPYTTERSSVITITNTTWIPSFSKNNTRPSLKFNENQLIIPNVQLEDGQLWKCIVANEYGSDSLEFQLEILGIRKNFSIDFDPFDLNLVPPEIFNEDTEELLQVENNNTVQLTCQTFAHPPALIEWRKNGNPIDLNKYIMYVEVYFQKSIHSVLFKN